MHPPLQDISLPIHTFVASRNSCDEVTVMIIGYGIAREVAQYALD
jgi:hypothetical protein